MKIMYIKKKVIYIILIAIVTIIFLSFIRVGIRNRDSETFARDIYYNGNIDKKVIAFACNVDWGEEYIPKLLDILEEEDISITFFVTGKWAEKNESLLKEIYNRGHQIGNHGYSHRDYGKLNYEINKSEIEKCHNVVYNILGIDCKYFAPPSGSFNDNTIKAANELNYDIIMWSIDTIDWREDTTEELIVQRILTKADNSHIVLMHPKENTIKALPYVIKSLKKDGFHIGNISDVIK
ncbi:polysaccharide deacetylase family protein [Anaerosalibacter sp. Marseille-P3206]|uniref:polysaccharide deacetylase family protein n=1 Tax=Anaerosalibacter sp. Marseille-P3206 TaxID=1871005 RepID=UPI0009850CA5|nr:polysaccharide deacetylase family protein [Anaerosalibacter sp. Marseille-P3206]